MTEELDRLAAAAERYAEQGELLKAVVALKRLMLRSPRDPRAQRALETVTRARERLRTPPKQEPASITSEGWTPVAAPAGPGEVLEARSIAEHIHARTADLVAGADEPLTELPLPHREVDPFPLTPLFSGIDAQAFKLLVEHLHFVELEPNEVLFHQGDPGHALYVIGEGAVEIALESPPATLARLDAGEFFGEIALVTDRPRTATARALEPTQLLEIDRRAISALIFADPNVMNVLLYFLRDRMVGLLVKTSPLFSRLDEEHARALAARFQVVEAKEGAALIRQGAHGRGLYVILAGEAQVVRSFGERQIDLGTLGPGDVVGEMSLLSREPAVATVTTRGRFMALELRAARFHELLAAEPALGAWVTGLAEQRRQAFVKRVEEELAYVEGSIKLV